MMKSKLLKKMLFPIMIMITVIILWQVFVLNLLEHAVISSFAALCLLCLFYAVIGIFGMYTVKIIFKSVKIGVAGIILQLVIIPLAVSRLKNADNE